MGSRHCAKRFATIALEGTAAIVEGCAWRDYTKNRQHDSRKVDCIPDLQ